MELLIGADPELFVVRNGHYISGHDCILGTKDRPMKTEHGALQNDGIALEFNIDPAATRTEFVSRVMKTMSALNNKVKHYDKSWELRATPAVSLGPLYLSTLPKSVQELGCRADKNAYTLDDNPAPDSKSIIRTAGGHIHIGWTQDADIEDLNHVINCAQIAQEMDYYLGLPSTIWDDNKLRRGLYGKAGAFRPKPYGMEYRVLSNAWCRSGGTMIRVYNGAVRAVHSIMTNETKNYLHIIHKETARNYIDSNATYRWQTHYPGLADEIYKDLKSDSDAADAAMAALKSI